MKRRRARTRKEVMVLATSLSPRVVMLSAFPVNDRCKSPLNINALMFQKIVIYKLQQLN